MTRADAYNYLINTNRAISQKKITQLRAAISR